MPDGAGIGDLRQLSGAASARQQYAIIVPGAIACQQYTIVVSDTPCVRSRQRS